MYLARVLAYLALPKSGFYLVANRAGLAENLLLAQGDLLNIGGRACAYKAKSGLVDAPSGVFGQS